MRRIKAQYGGRAESIMAAKSHGVTVRFERGEEKYLTRPHIETPFEKVFIFPNFVRDDGFYEGDYTFQSVGSVAICNIVEPCKEFLDACAAPGGKSVLLSKKATRVTSCELHEHRVRLIESYISRMGAENVTVVQGDSSVFDPDLSERFDGVLCDVPCSGLGTVAENPDLPLRKSEEDLSSLRKTQLAILTNCARYVKKGGALYYSTCSILSEENDGIVGSFLKEETNFTAEEIDSPLSREKTQYGLQFLPDTAFGAGFYVCKMRKKL